MRNGKGVYHFGENDKIDVTWKNNLPHGKGILTYNGKVIEGEFRFGKLVKGEISSSKKVKKHKKSFDDHKHKHHKHRPSHSTDNKHKKNKHRHSEDKNSNNEKNKDKDSNSCNTKEKELVEIDCIPRICVKKKK